MKDTEKTSLRGKKKREKGKNIYIGIYVIQLLSRIYYMSNIDSTLALKIDLQGNQDFF